MTQITQLQPGGWGGRKYGSFAGKPASSVSKGAITQLQLGGWGGMRYGSFAGKPASAPTVNNSFIFCSGPTLRTMGRPSLPLMS